jgi:hypothetical protein
MKLKTVISHLHKLLPGETVSYGGTFTADSERLIATIPIGYADGFLRAYSGAFVTVNTQNGPKTAPLVGRICMDQCMLDVTDTGACVGDVVTLFGNDPKELSALGRYHTAYLEEWRAEEHPADERYVADISSERPSRQAQARELWLQTEHLWEANKEFIEALKAHRH